MTLYINRWGGGDGDLHVFNLDPENVEQVGSNPNHSSAVEADLRCRTSLCGKSADEANEVEGIAAAHPNDLLRLSRLSRWDGLEDFADAQCLCEVCRIRLPLEWPPARELLDIEVDKTAATIVSESPNEVIVDTGSEKYSIDPDCVPEDAALGDKLEWWNANMTPLEEA